ncbi:hypothetical protein EDC01DRAFT_651342 [Geopyxis carbonaria]|nr:hypothetical protein EDC01DRAFT_651342 [Geopyxis carbonaria]
MSEPGPSSIPTSSDPRSKRPTKRRALSPTSAQAAAVAQLLSNPDKEIKIQLGPKARTLPTPPEIVANVQGSSAGAGSGEFHVYKASRRREYERLRLMDEEVRKEEETRLFNQKVEEMRKKDEEKTGKNRKRRMKRKEKLKPGKKDEAMEDAPQHTTVADTNGKAELNGESNNSVHDEGAAVVQNEGGIVIHDDDE